MSLAKFSASLKRFIRRAALVVWQQAWWFVLGLAAVSFMFGRYFALIFIIVSAFAVWVAARVAGWVASLKGGRAHHRPISYHFAKWGLLIISFAFFFSLVAVCSGVSLIYIIAGLLVSIIVSDALIGAVGVGDISVERQIPEHIFAGQPFRVKLKIRNNKRILSSYGLRVIEEISGPRSSARREVPVPYIPAASEVTIDYGFSLSERGVHNVKSLKVVSDFPLGILVKVAQLPVHRLLLVLPKTGIIQRELRFAQDSLEHNMIRRYLPQARQLEFFGLREYREGDNPRYIHWRTSARKQELFVKEFDRYQGKNLLILLDSYVPDSYDTLPDDRLDALEKAISFVATLAEDFLKAGTFYAFAAWGPELYSLPFDVGPGHFFRVLETLAKIERNEEKTLIELVESLDVSKFGGALTIAVHLGDVPGRFVQQYMSPQSILIDVHSPEFQYEFQCD